MRMLDSSPDLRRLLRLDNLDAEQHRQEIERIRMVHPHGIRFVASRGDQTCALYALSLTDDPTYRAVAGFHDVFAGKDFMTWAIHGGSFEELGEGREGDLVCYFYVSEWRHIGVMAGTEQVTSKWGTYPLYRHGLAEVSEDYGDRVRFFARPSPIDALSCFLEFSYSRGLSEVDIAAARRLWHE